MNFKLEKLLLSYGDQFVQLRSLESGHLDYMRERVGKSERKERTRRDKKKGREERRRGEEDIRENERRAGEK